jgi:hypothetical protein
VNILGTRIGVIAALASAMAIGITTAAPAATTGAWGEMSSIHIAGDSNEIHALVATGQDDIWAFGNDYSGTLGEWRAFGERWTGGSWTRVNMSDRETAPVEDLVYGAAATGPNDVWTVGGSSTAPGIPTRRELIEHWDGTSWQIVEPNVNDIGVSRGLIGVATPEAGKVWAVGEANYGGGSDSVPLVLHKSGSQWTHVPFDLRVPGCPSSSGGEIDSVVAKSDTDVYVAGRCAGSTGLERAYIAHWDGANWSLAYEPTSGKEITSLTVAPDGQVWAGGDNGPTHGSVERGLLWHDNGTTWTMAKLPTGQATGGIRTIAATSRKIYAGGSYDKGLTYNYVIAYNPATGKSHYERIFSLADASYIFVDTLVIAPGGRAWFGGLADTASPGAIVGFRQTVSAG